MKIAFKEEKSQRDHRSVLPISLLPYKCSCLQIRKPDKMLHTGKNETVTFTDEGTGLTSTSPHRSIIFIIVGLGIRALGLRTRCIQVSKKAYVGMTKGHFVMLILQMGSLHHKNLRGPRAYSLYHSEHLLAHP